MIFRVLFFPPTQTKPYFTDARDYEVVRHVRISTWSLLAILSLSPFPGIDLVAACDFELLCFRWSTRYLHHITIRKRNIAVQSPESRPQVKPHGTVKTTSTVYSRANLNFTAFPQICCTSLINFRVERRPSQNEILINYSKVRFRT